MSIELRLDLFHTPFRTYESDIAEQCDVRVGNTFKSQSYGSLMSTKRRKSPVMTVRRCADLYVAARIEVICKLNLKREK